MNVWGVTFGGCLAKILSFKLGNLLYKSNFYLLLEGTVPHPTAQGSLTRDAPETGMGAVLEQYIAGKWRPLGYWSRHPNKTQQKWSPFELELYAV